MLTVIIHRPQQSAQYFNWLLSLPAALGPRGPCCRSPNAPPGTAATAPLPEPPARDSNLRPPARHNHTPHCATNTQKVKPACTHVPQCPPRTPARQPAPAPPTAPAQPVHRPFAPPNAKLCTGAKHATTSRKTRKTHRQRTRAQGNSTATHTTQQQHRRVTAKSQVRIQQVHPSIRARAAATPPNTSTCFR
ncbi:hypothetical protein NEAUS03_1786 [Nematocida ausubeli]|nr:hypothetical protein NEAUS03_1786 [Nematocida ausubeli]KAI5186393.1 hypothetical protein NEIRO03_2265 [Nematocida sp. AWRm78]